jgi:uncharacterized protein with PQ loop repeat
VNLGFLHLHSRKRLAKNDPFPSRKGFKRIIDHVMFFIACIAPLALVPQVYSIYATHNVQGLVGLTWWILASFNILWILYGLAHRTMPVVMTNFFFFFLNSAGAIGIILYR